MPGLSITAFLIRKSSYADFGRFLVGLGNGVSLHGGMSGTFYAITDNPTPPLWVAALSGSYVPSAALTGLVSQSPAAILTCRVNGKLFAVTFGHAWMKLSSDWIDHSFGRRVALNSIADGDLRQLRSEQVLAKRHRSIERSPVSATLYEFGYESDRDLVFSVEGVCRVPPFVGNVRGGAPVRFDVEIDLLPKALYAASQRLGYGYQKKFPDIDNLVPVDSKGDIAALDFSLDAEMVGGNIGNRIGLAPPASLEVFDQDIYFSYGRWSEARHARSWSLQYAEWVASLGSSAPNLRAASTSSIHVVEAGSGIRKTSITAKDAISYDLVRPDGHYLIFSGKWYKASPNLDRKLVDFLSALDVSSFPPPVWNGADDEATYNIKACASAAALVHMDARHVFYGGGQSKFEFCDFADPANKVLYFVKNPASAAGMSHLYEQARRTSELFFGNNADYLQKVRLALQRNRPGINVSWLATPPRAVEWEICLVSMGRTAANLAMFAKCGLMRVHRDLSGRVRQVSYNVV